MTRVARNRIVTVGVAATLIAAIFVTAAPVGAAGPTCFGQRATIVARAGVTTYGTSGADVIVGTSGPDIIKSRGGPDLVCSLGGDDRVFGGGGRDLIDLGSGNDYSRGGRARDHIYGGSGNDLLRGRKGADTLNGQAGIDRCYGGRGIDTLTSCNESSAGSLSTASLSTAETEMIGLVRNLRAAYGVGGLKVSAALSDVARDWSKKLPGGFYHNPNVGNQIPSNWTAWGENIAYNTSISAAFTALVNSPGHLANMIDPRYTHIGVGVHISGGRVYVTQVFARY